MEGWAFVSVWVGVGRCRIVQYYCLREMLRYFKFKISGDRKSYCKRPAQPI